MKKKLLVLGALGIVPFMTACGGSTSKLTCSYKTGIGEINYIFEFDSSDKLTKAHLEQVVDYEKAECGTADECKEDAKKALENCKEEKDYTSCSLANESDKGVTIKATITDEALKKDDTISTGTSKEDVKSQFEKAGYICK